MNRPGRRPRLESGWAGDRWESGSSLSAHLDGEAAEVAAPGSNPGGSVGFEPPWVIKRWPEIDTSAFR